MAKTAITKRALIDQANSTVVIITSIAAFIFVFSLVASKTLISQATYQGRVITAKKQAVHQLRSDLDTSSSLSTSYKAFVGGDQNVLGGNPTGTGDKDGDNAKIVLDALPSSYDFPALATSLENIMTTQQGLTINSITGTDDEINQSGNTTSATPTPVAMPFEVSVSGDYDSVKGLIDQFEHSIRPFQMQTINLSGDSDKLTVDITAQTFYQPAKVLNTKNTKVVK